MIQKKLEEMNLMDDFLMNRMMSDPECGEAFAKGILRIILGREPGKLLVIPQRTEYGRDTGKHGIRLDVYLEEEGAGIYDLEVDRTKDTVHRESLPKRVRFYHAKIDADTLASGTPYGKLRDVCVIFITDFDPFGLNRMVYTVKNTCWEVPEMPYEDGATTIFLYTRGTAGSPAGSLSRLLRYMEDTTETNAVEEELEQIHQMVQKVKRKGETGLAYYGLCEKIEEATRQAMERGWEKGRKKGREEGIGDSVLFLLDALGSVPAPLREHILQEKKEDTLKSWLMIAARAKSVEEFRETAYL